MIALITTTGARAEAFELCKQHMEAQTYNGEVTWIIVDDADPITTANVPSDFKPNWEIVKIYPQPRWAEGQNTQGRNLKAGIDYVKTLENVSAIFIIEDDDYYSPNYLQAMVDNLKQFDAIGETRTVYYNVSSRYYYENPNEHHASLFQTAFTPALIPLMESCYAEKFIDIKFWQGATNKNLFKANNLAVGMKGLAGRMGIGCGHQIRREPNDPEMAYLKKLVGKDYVKYKDFYGKHNRGVQNTYIVREPKEKININILPI
jgi:hypothetical protein